MKDSAREHLKILNDSGFRALFGLGEDEPSEEAPSPNGFPRSTRTISKEIYQQMYDRFSEFYDKKEIAKYNLIRMDSTIVSEASSRLKREHRSEEREKAGKIQLLI
ncbi:hypothetical protein ACFSBF_08230 [Sphingobacterium suaedae]